MMVAFCTAVQKASLFYFYSALGNDHLNLAARKRITIITTAEADIAAVEPRGFQSKAQRTAPARDADAYTCFTNMEYSCHCFYQ